MPLKIRNGSSAWSTASAIKVRNGSGGWSSVTTGRVRGASGWQIFFTSGAYTVNSGTGLNVYDITFGPTTYFSGWSSVAVSAYTDNASKWFPDSVMGSISSTPVVNGATVVAVYGSSFFAPSGGTSYAQAYSVVVSGNWPAGTINTLTIDGNLYNSTPTRIDIFGSGTYTAFSWSIPDPFIEVSKFDSTADSVSIT